MAKVHCPVGATEGGGLQSSLRDYCALLALRPSSELLGYCQSSRRDAMCLPLVCERQFCRDRMRMDEAIGREA